MTMPSRRTRPSEVALTLWQALARAGEQGLTAADAAARGVGSEVYIRKTLRMWASAGFVERRGAKSDARDACASFHPVAGMAKSPPMVRLDGTVEPRADAAMTARQFAAHRRRLGLSLAAMGAALGWEGLSETRSRAMRKFENGDRPIDAGLAAKVAELAASAAGRKPAQRSE